jgi:hypothetical protein
MAEVNIFGNIDVTGILKDFKTQIDAYYGGDPTVQSPTPNVLNKIKDPSFPPIKLGYYDTSVLPSYTRLVSAKSSTLGYEIRPQDLTTRGGKQYLTNTYNLSIMASNGDIIRWWGHAIVPNISTQAIISKITNPRSSTPPTQFGTLTNTNVTFYNTGGAVDPTDLMKGLDIATRSAFCITGTLNGTVGTTIPYDISILILSAPLVVAGSLLTYPIVEVVVDPSVIITS